MILTVQTDRSFSEKPLLDIAPKQVVAGLLENDYDEIDLVGLGALGCRLRDGAVWDLMPLRTEHDAEFLAQGWVDLQGVLVDKRPSRHWVYLGDGSFEITAELLDDCAHVRIGEYAGESGTATGVVLTMQQYVSFWNSILAGILSGLSTAPPGNTPPPRR